jgi:acetolactate synthase-1/2/3 large subunit
MTGAEVIAAQLAALGVRHVFGVGGANIEDLYLAVQRRRPETMAVLDKHEHSAGTAADAYARVSGSLGIVMATSGGGAMNLVPALAESRASRVSVLAIVGEPPTSLQGRGAFQDTSGRAGSVDARAVFQGVSSWCERATRADDLPALVVTAVRAARRHSAPAVLLVAKDLQQAPVGTGVAIESAEPAPPECAADPAAIRAAALVLAARPVVIIAGEDVARAGVQQDLKRLAVALDARVAVTPDARDAFDNRSARFAGVAGAMGHESATRAVASAAVCLVVGTRLPLLARQGLEDLVAGRPLLSIAREPPFLSGRESLHVPGDLAVNLRALVSAIDGRGRDANDGEASPPSARREPWADTALPGSESVLALVERTLPEDGVVLVDAGSTGAHAVHHLHSPRGGHWLIAMGMAGMGYTFGAAIGAAFATGRRSVVLAGDGAFFMHGLEIHTAVQHRLPITYVLFNNQAHGMCLIRERILLGEESGYNAFTESHLGSGLAAMFPGLHACDCKSHEALERALAHAATIAGPSVVCAELGAVEVPPFAALRSALAAQGQARDREARA